MPQVKGKKIRAWRQRTGMRLGQFAEYSGIGYHTLKNLESGHGNPSIEVVHRLAGVFGCEAEELLGEDEPEVTEAAA